MHNVYSVLGGYCNLKGLWIQGSCLNLSPSPPAPLNKNNKKKWNYTHKEGNFYLTLISAILHGTGMGVCFNENGTSKCTSGANYISQCWDWPKGDIVIWDQYTKGVQTRPQLFKRWISVRETNCVIHWIEIYPVDSAIQLLNNWGQYNWTGMVKFIYMRPASWKYKWSHKACKNSAY